MNVLSRLSFLIFNFFTSFLILEFRSSNLKLAMKRKESMMKRSCLPHDRFITPNFPIMCSLHFSYFLRFFLVFRPCDIFRILRKLRILLRHQIGHVSPATTAQLKAVTATLRLNLQDAISESERISICDCEHYMAF